MVWCLASAVDTRATQALCKVSLKRKNSTDKSIQIFRAEVQCSKEREQNFEFFINMDITFLSLVFNPSHLVCRLCIMSSKRVQIIIKLPYSGKLSREKTFANFAIFPPSAKVFSTKF